MTGEIKSRTMFLNDTRVINITMVIIVMVLYSLAKLHTRFDVKINKMKYIETYLVSVIRKFINFISNRERKILTTRSLNGDPAWNI